MLSQRSHHRPSISSQGSFDSATALDQKSQQHARRPSLTNTIAWLSRTHNSLNSLATPPNSTQALPSPKARGSGPFSFNPHDPVPRGTLGHGATVVRTPEEALTGTAVLLAPETIIEEEAEYVQEEYENVVVEMPTQEKSELDLGELPSPPHSPPVSAPPPTQKHLSVEQAKSTPDTPPPRTPQSASLPAPPPNSPHHSRAVVMTPPTPPLSDRYPSLPSSTSTQPFFGPILMSSRPPATVDRSGIVVTLETATATHRATFQTLTSRPSALANYLTSLTPSDKQDEDQPTPDTSPMPDSPFQAIFDTYVNPPQSPSFTLQIFLDRPSAPYTHILNYLRSPTTNPPTLPRAVQLRPLPIPSVQRNFDRDRMEALLELLDEATHLDLEELQKLCADEIAFASSHPPPSQESSHGSSRVHNEIDGSSSSLQPHRAGPNPEVPRHVSKSPYPVPMPNYSATRSQSALRTPITHSSSPSQSREHMPPTPPYQQASGSSNWSSQERTSAQPPRYDSGTAGGKGEEASRTRQRATMDSGAPDSAPRDRGSVRPLAKMASGPMDGRDDRSRSRTLRKTASDILDGRDERSYGRHRSNLPPSTPSSGTAEGRDDRNDRSGAARQLANGDVVRHHARGSVQPGAILRPGPHMSPGPPPGWI